MRFLSLVHCIAVALTLAGTARADAPKIPDERPLTEAEIKAHIHGKTFDLVAYDEPLTGVTTWNFDTETVSGSYAWDKKDKGTFEIEMFIENDRLCTRQKKGNVCQVVYRYQDGFMEVTPAGVVHAVSIPQK